MNTSPRFTAALLAALVTCLQAGRAAEPAEIAQKQSGAAEQLPPDVILVVGAAGEDFYAEAFASWAARWQHVAKTAGASLTQIGPQPPTTGKPVGDPAADAVDSAPDDSPPPDESVSSESDASDRERLQTALANLAPEPTAPVWIVLIGHGTFSQNVAKFNLRGSDVSADELAAWLQPLNRPLVVINAASSSGPFINALSGANRVILTATQSGSEQNYARFGDYLSRAIADTGSDIDHDAEVSILEAFLAASAATRDFYQSAGRIATEHALIDDNGDGLGTPATAFRGVHVVAKTSDPEQSIDGGLAARITLSPASTRLPFTEQELIERDEIEAHLAQLRARRDAMPPEDYQASLLPHLLRLARLYQAAEARAVAAAR